MTGYQNSNRGLHPPRAKVSPMRNDPNRWIVDFRKATYQIVFKPATGVYVVYGRDTGNGTRLKDLNPEYGIEDVVCWIENNC